MENPSNQWSRLPGVKYSQWSLQNHKRVRKSERQLARVLWEDWPLCPNLAAFLEATTRWHPWDISSLINKTQHVYKEMGLTDENLTKAVWVTGLERKEALQRHNTNTPSTLERTSTPGICSLEVAVSFIPLPGGWAQGLDSRYCGLCTMSARRDTGARVNRAADRLGWSPARGGAEKLGRKNEAQKESSRAKGNHPARGCRGRRGRRGHSPSCRAALIPGGGLLSSTLFQTEKAKARVLIDLE